MKTNLVVLAAWTAMTSAALAGGPQIGISIGTRGGWCAPVCPPVAYCPPVVYRSYPAWYGCPPISYYYWGPSVVVSSVGNGAGFSNVSPVMNYQNTTPVYRVPAPIIPAQPVTVYPASNFGWRR